MYIGLCLSIMFLKSLFILSGNSFVLTNIILAAACATIVLCIVICYYDDHLTQLISIMVDCIIVIFLLQNIPHS